MRILLGIFFLVESFYLISGFNFDLENPLIIKNSFQPRSQFGASVSFVTGSVSSWLIIGAPKANSSLQNQANIFEPGNVWRCSLGNRNERCEVLVMDERGNELQDYQYTDKVYNRKDDGRLSEAAFIGDSDRFVACAPKWSNQRAAINSAESVNQSHYFMNGLCYWRPKAHILQQTLPPPLSNHTLIPLRNKDRQRSSGGINSTSESFDWAFGEAGFSIHITDKNEMILGAPGVNDYRGSVIRLLDSSMDVVALQRNGQKPEYGNVFYAEPFITRPELDDKLNLRNTYFGYAVTAGRFFNSADGKFTTQFAAGAPRGGVTHSLAGHVTIFNFPKSDMEPLDEIQVLESPADTGAYFGSVLCSVDLNKDGYADLLVTAPRFSSKRKELSQLKETGPQSIPGKFTGSGDEGIVFMYLSNGVQMGNPEEIRGGNKPWSHFGSAISSIGDINQDGYNDVAISAPYEDSGRGAVYIFHGGENGLTKKYSQVIHAKNLDLSLMGFGSSISLGADVDRNNYNDLAIGAYASSHVVVLRTRPIVTISGSLSSPLTNINLNATNFNFTACVNYTGNNAPPTLNIRVHLSSDADTKLGRVHIIIPGSNETNQTYIHIVQARLGDSTCNSFQAVVRRPLTLSQGGIAIRQEFYLEDETGGKSQKTVTMYDIQYGGFGTPPQLAISGPEFASFCKTCPRRNLNKENYLSLSLPLAVPCGTDNICNARLKVDASFEGVIDDTFIMGTAAVVVLHVVLKNLEETAINPGVTVSWTKRNLIELPPNCVSVTPTNLTCTLGDILRSDTGESKDLYLKFEMSDLIAGHQNTPDKFVLAITGTTVSHQLDVARVDKMLDLKAIADISVLGEQELEYFYETNPAQIFSHFYNVSLEGPSTLSNVELSVDIPFQIDSLSEGSPFVNITNIMVRYDGQDLPYSAMFNGISIFSSESYLAHHGRDPDLDDLDINADYSDAELIGRDLRKREISDTPNEIKKQGSKTSLAVKDKEIQIECSSNAVHCAKLTSKIDTFTPNTFATIEISMKIATQDMRNLMLMYKADGVQIRSHAHANVDRKFQPFPHKPDTYDCITTISTTSGETPQWVVPASIFGGLLILACITLCLWAMGVFDRKTPKESEELPEERAEMAPLNQQGSIEEEDEVFVSD